VSLLWNPWAIPGLLGAALFVASAAILYFTAPQRRLNRMASVMLYVNGFHVLASGSVSLVLFTDAASAGAAVGT